VVAAILGKPGELGQIKPGMLAEMAAFDGDPASDIGALRKVSFVMKSGKVVRPKR
jgi:imidazolonepropionase-like amidohydrolase